MALRTVTLYEVYISIHNCLSIKPLRQYPQDQKRDDVHVLIVGVVELGLWVTDAEKPDHEAISEDSVVSISST